MALPLQHRSVRRSFKQPTTAALDGWPLALTSEIQRVMPHAGVRTDGRVVHVSCNLIEATVSVVVRGRRVEAVYTYDSTQYIRRRLREAALFASLVLALGVLAFGRHGIGVGAASFVVAVVWVGYGNLLLAHWWLTRSLTKAVGSLAGRPPR